MELNIELEESPSEVGLNLEPPLQESSIGYYGLNFPAFDLNLPAFDLNLPTHDSGIDWTFEPIQDVAGNLIPDVVEGGIDLNVEPPVPARRRNDVPCEDRKRVYQELLARSTNGRLKRGVTKAVAERFGIHVRTVQRIWKQGKPLLGQGIAVVVPSRKRGRVGRKPIPLDLEPLRNADLKDRTTVEDVCALLHISHKKLSKYLRQGLIKRHSNSIKTHLTDANKKARLQWCLDMLDQDSMLNDPKFKGLFDTIFIDEKWFYLTRKSERYYLLEDEDEPLRTCRSKNNIPKIMFLCATARPRFDENGVCIFYGKIGCFPLVTFERAKRRSVNRPAGTLEVKPIPSITRDVIREFMINQVLPAIRAKWPRADVGKPIYIQQDNAPLHMELDDPQFVEAAKQDGFDIRLICQPPNSPDFNILDLGFFRAIQAIQYKKHAKTVQDLVPIVQQAFQEYSPRKVNRIYITLQQVLKEAMKVQGSNKFKIPHMKKGSLERQGCLPVQIACEVELITEATAKLAAWNM